MINAHWPQLSRRTKARMLGEYFILAMEQMQSVHMIGGQMGAPLFLDDYVHKHTLNYQISACEDLSVLTTTGFYSSFPLESSMADALVFHLWRGRAAEPGATNSDPVSVEPPDSDGSLTNSDPVKVDSVGHAAEHTSAMSNA